MYSRAQIAGHPVHPMLIAFPVAFYTGTLAAFVVYSSNGQQFWLNMAIALCIGGAGSAIIAALPGFIDVAFGIPRDSEAKRVGLAHGACNVAALGLFIATAIVYFDNWNGPARSANLGLALTAAGVLLTLVAGALGWTLVQTYHIGIWLTARQTEDEIVVQHEPALTAVRHGRV